MTALAMHRSSSTLGLLAFLLAAATSGCSSPTVLRHADPPMLFDIFATTDAAAAVYSPRSDLVVSGNRDRIKLWDPAEEAVVAGESGPVWAHQGLAFSPDGTLLAAPGTTKGLASMFHHCGIRIFKVPSLEKVQDLEGPISGASSLAFSPDAKTLLCGGYDGTVTLWDVGSAKRVWYLLFLERQTQPAHGVAFSPDGKTVAATVFRDGVGILDAATGATIANVTTAASAVAFSPDGRTLAIGLGGEVALVSAGDWKETRRLGSSAADAPAFADLAWSHDGRLLAVACADGTARLFEVPGWRELEPLSGHEGPVYSVSFSRDDRHLATAGKDGTVRLWTVPEH